VDAGLFVVPDLELAAYDLLLLAHAWALKHWYFERTLSLETYVERQLALVLRSIIEPRHRREYAALIATT
jgi:TetR/AcrR family transcriptional regulator, cholesterol catabolism regulator